MVTVKSQKTQEDLGPRELSVENVQYFSQHTQQFAKSQIHKAKKFIEHKCYEYAGEGFFICNNIPGYNTRTYHIRKNQNTHEFDCDCQKSRDNSGMCSHVLGLFYAFKIKYFKE